MGVRLRVALTLMAVCVGLLKEQALGQETKDRSSAAKLLAEMAAGSKDVEHLRLEVQWNYDSPKSFVPDRGGRNFDVRIVVREDGYGYVNDAVEFRLNKEQLRQILKWLDQADFLDARGDLNGREYKKVTGPDGKEEMIFNPEVGRIHLAVGGAAVNRGQFKDHAGSPGFARLGIRLANYCLEASHKGVRAESVADGLKKMQKNQLRSALLGVEVCRTLGVDSKQIKHFLRLNGEYAQFYAYSGKDFKALSAVWGYDAGIKALAEAIELLHAIHADGSNPSFFAPHPTTIKVQILDQTLEIVADRFAGLGTSPTAQDRFDRLCELLERLEVNCQKEGQVLPIFR